ncbi:expressed unknown protein [Seminavis robusta]|uniref:Uncharacterized protein n=1 Tax=Seminavis robusta TaxID=568900 RepID=A0A9N8E7T8_9STRA|nr:expressed unknown protein [Seminavis robusta]|eukprot:Sro641_g180030.1 n/a (330) ;mRNA; r:28151-29140
MMDTVAETRDDGDLLLEAAYDDYSILTCTMDLTIPPHSPPQRTKGTYMVEDASKRQNEEIMATDTPPEEDDSVVRIGPPLLTMIPHDETVAWAEELLQEADRALHASNLQKEVTVIKRIVAQINGKPCQDDNTNQKIRTPPPPSQRKKLDDIVLVERTPRMSESRPPLDPNRSSPKRSPRLFRECRNYVLLLWRINSTTTTTAKGDYDLKIPSASAAARLSMMDIYPFAFALYASSSLSELKLPDDLLCAKLQVVLWNDSPQCEFVPHGHTPPEEQNHFFGTVLTCRRNRNRNSKDCCLPRTLQEQKPYLCLIMALLRRLRVQLLHQGK